MTYDILATGSSGNAVVIGGEILIDCGVPMKKLRESGYIQRLRLVLLTHEHGDHFNAAAVRALHRERPALRWACCGWMVPHLLAAGVDTRVIDAAGPAASGETGRALIYSGFAAVRPVPLIHDVPNCGWEVQRGEERLFYATDTSTLAHIEAKGCGCYLIEANHTQAEIEARTADKLARGEFAYEARAARTHLSREQALEWLARNAGPNSEYVFLHQHKEKDHVYQLPAQ